MKLEGGREREREREREWNKVKARKSVSQKREKDRQIITLFKRKQKECVKTIRMRLDRGRRKQTEEERRQGWNLDIDYENKTKHKALFTSLTGNFLHVRKSRVILYQEVREYTLIIKESFKKIQSLVQKETVSQNWSGDFSPFQFVLWRQHYWDPSSILLISKISGKSVSSSFFLIRLRTFENSRNVYIFWVIVS